MPRRRRKNLILEHIPKEGVKRFKVRLDRRTVITVNSMKAFNMWKERYPNAEIVKD